MIATRLLSALGLLCALSPAQLAEAHSAGTDKMLESMMQDNDSQASTDTPLMRLSVIKPLLAAQRLVKDGKFAEALDKLHEIDAIPDHRKIEIDAVERTRVVAAADADQPAVAAQSFAGLEASGSLAGPQKLNFCDDIASAYFRASDYPATIAWASRYLAEGGDETRVKSMLMQAYYFTADYAAAGKSAAALIAAEEQSGQTVTESQLQILANSAIKQNDPKQVVAALEKLVAAYPKPDYWATLIRRVAA